MVTLVGIGIIGLAGSMKSASLSEEEKKKAVKDFNFTKGIIVALLAGFMSACFSIGLGFGEKLCFAESADIFKTLPATLMVTLGGFITNAVYCFYQNSRNKSWGDYGKKSLYVTMSCFVLWPVCCGTASSLVLAWVRDSLLPLRYCSHSRGAS